MIYPEFLKKNDTIGICAPSAGVGKKLEDFDQSLQYLKDAEFSIKESESVRVNNDRSASGKQRAVEFNTLILDETVSMVYAAAGGDFLDECLPYIDYEEVRNHPKWIAGYSDPTSILYALTTKYDVATIYGSNAGSYEGLEFMNDHLRLLQGQQLQFHSYERHMSKPRFLVDTVEYDKETKWTSNHTQFHVQGRMYWWLYR